MNYNIGIMTDDECSLAISTIEDLKLHLAKDKDIINENAYLLVYFALCELQDGINKKIIEKTNK